MPLRLELPLTTAAPTKVVVTYLPDVNRFLVIRFLDVTPDFLAAFKADVSKRGLSPNQAVFEANARTRGGSEELPWALLNTYTGLSKKTQRLVDRAFAHIFNEITLESDGVDADFNEIGSGKRMRLYLRDDGYFWLDMIGQISTFIIGPTQSPRT